MEANTVSNKKEVPQRIIGAVADAFNKSSLTISRWFEAKDDRLTSDKAKAVYAQEGFDYEAYLKDTDNADSSVAE